MVQPLWKTVWWFLRKLNLLLPYDPIIVLLGIYPKELKTYIDAKTCAWVFITTLLIIATTWKQPRYPSLGEWINKLVHPDNGILVSAIKKWQKLKYILLNKTSQSEKATYCMIPTV